MFHLFVPSEAEKKSDKWEKKNADLIFLSHIQEPLEDTTEIFNEEKINTYAFKEGDLVKYGETVGRVVSSDGSQYKVKTSEGNNTMIKIEEMFLTTESEQQLQIEKKLNILQATIDEKKDELEKINLLVQIEITRNKLQDAEDVYQNSSWDIGNKLWNARSKILMRLRVILPDALRAVKQDYIGDDELDEDATVKVLLEFKVNVLEKLKDEQRAVKYSLSKLKRQLTPQEQYLNTLKGVKTMAQQNKLLHDYEQNHPILWTWRKCYDLTFDNMKWKKRPAVVREEKKLLNEYFQTTFEKNKDLYEQYNSGTTDEVNALFIKVSKRMETKRTRIMSKIKAANDEVGFIINCLEHFALFQFCELYQRKLREIKMLEKYTKIEKTIEI